MTSELDKEQILDVSTAKELPQPFAYQGRAHVGRVPYYSNGAKWICEGVGYVDNYADLSALSNKGVNNAFVANVGLNGSDWFYNGTSWILKSQPRFTSVQSIPLTPSQMGICNFFVGGVPYSCNGADFRKAVVGMQPVLEHLELNFSETYTAAPELHYVGKVGHWFHGIDVANHGGGADFVLVGRWRTNNTADDLLYLNYNDGLNEPATLGYCFTPPPSLAFRHWFAAADTLNTMGGMAIRVGPSQTASAFAVIDSSLVEQLKINADFSITGKTRLVIKSDTGNTPLALAKSDGTGQYGWYYSGNSLAFKYIDGNIPLFMFDTNGHTTVFSRFSFGNSSDDGVNIAQVYGNLAIKTAGAGLKVAEGVNCKQGVATLVAGTVTVANNVITANSRIFLTSQQDGGTPGFLRVSTRTAGTSFTITSSSGSDTSVVAYQIFEPA